MPVERGPGLCPAPHHAPRHAPRPPAGRGTNPLMHRLVPTLVSEMGEAYPELKRAQDVHRGHAEARKRIRFRTTLGRRAWPCSTTATVQGFQDGRHAGRPRRPSSSVGHLRLPAGPDAGRGPSSSGLIRSTSTSYDSEAMAEPAPDVRARTWKGSGQTANAAEWLARCATVWGRRSSPAMTRHRRLRAKLLGHHRGRRRPRR